MSAIVFLGIACLGGIGAVIRFLIDGSLAARLALSFPVGTFVVNLSGAFLLGLLAGATSDHDATRLIATGLLGSFTTFSTWALESQRLGEDGELGLAAVNFGASLVLGVALAWAGTEIGGLA